MAHGFESPGMLESGFSSKLVLHSPGFSEIGVGNVDACDSGYVADCHDFMVDRNSTFFNPTSKDLASWPKPVAERWKRIHRPKN